MTNYSMQQGRVRNDKIKLIKRIVLFTLVFWGVVMFLRFSAERDAKIMEIEYCWDSNGQHYVAPNEACR